MNKETKARQYKSRAIEELLNEATPTEVEQVQIKMQIAARIEDLMHSRGWNKSQFAESLGKNKSEITKWLSGTQNFTLDTLTEISVLFKVDLGYFFKKEEKEILYRTSKEIKVRPEPAPIKLKTPSVKHALGKAQYFSQLSTFFPSTNYAQHVN